MVLLALLQSEADKISDQQSVDGSLHLILIKMQKKIFTDSRKWKELLLLVDVESVQESKNAGASRKNTTSRCQWWYLWIGSIHALGYC